MYAHCNWYDDRSGQLAFVNVEELAKEKRPVRDLRSLKVHHVDVALLQEIERFFVHTDALLAYANYESRLKRGKIKHRVFAKPTLMAYPSLFL